MLTNFRTYQMALALYEYGQTIVISRSFLRDQFDRATLSITLNLAEGSGKATAKDRKKFYTIAMGSLREVQALLDILKDEKAKQMAHQIGGSIYKLLQNPGR